MFLSEDLFHCCDLCLEIGIVSLIVFVRGTVLKSYHTHESCHDEFVLKQPSHLHEKRYEVCERERERDIAFDALVGPQGCQKVCCWS